MQEDIDKWTTLMELAAIESGTHIGELAFQYTPYNPNEDCRWAVYAEFVMPHAKPADDTGGWKYLVEFCLKCDLDSVDNIGKTISLHQDMNQGMWN